MSRRWVLDASPLIVLTEAGYAYLLLDLADDLVIPETVRDEIHRPSETDAAQRWMHSNGAQFVRSASPIRPEVAAWDLGRGEQSVLSWAFDHPGWEAIVDDRAARTCAGALDVPVRGTLGLLLRAKSDGRIPDVRTPLSAVRDAGLYVSDALAQEILKLAGEQ